MHRLDLTPPPLPSRAFRPPPRAPGSPPRPDLRLVLPAATAWATAVVAGSHPRLALVLVVAGAVAAAVAVVTATPRRRAVALALAGLVACALAAFVATAARAAATAAGPLATLARDRAVVTLDLTVTGDPRSLTGRVVGAQRVADTTVVDARADRIVAAGRSVRLRRPVTVFARAGGWSARLPGERLRATGRLRPQFGSGAVAAFEPDGPPRRLQAASLSGRLAGRLRAGLRDAADVLPAEARGLLPGLVVGDTSRLDPAVREDFRRTGLTHLVAVSGQNVAIFLAALLLVVRRAGVGPRTAAVLGGLGLAFFVVLARPSPSVLRAATMGGLGLLATVTGRERAAVRVLAGSVLLLVLLDPSLARSLGFALSVAATAGLLVLGPPWRSRLARRVPGWLADAVATPLAAQAACAPLLAAAFGRVSLVAVPANVLAAPAVPPATVAGVAAAALAPVCLPLARAAAWLGGLPTTWLVHVAREGARVPAAQVGVPSGLAGAALTVGLVLAVAVVVRRRAGRNVTLTALAAIVLAAALVHQIAPAWPPPGWRLVACDVGQGDALVVRTHVGAVLVDTGPDPFAVDRCLRDLHVRRLATVVLTHFHADHVEGLPGALRGRQAREIVTGPLDEPPDERARVLRWAAARRLAVRVAALGEHWTVGDATFDVLGPEAAFHGTDSDPNNSSLVLRLTAPGLVLLLTGDIEEPAQLAVLARGPVGQADVLKVPHHGSARQTGEFLDATGAAAAIVSVGRDNPYGHPAPSTLDALAAEGMRTFRTDRDGDVAVTPVPHTAGTGPHVRVVGRHGRGRPSRATPSTAAEAVRVSAERAIAWRRATEPGSWCPVRATGRAPVPRPLPPGTYRARGVAGPLRIRPATTAPHGTGWSSAARAPPPDAVPARGRVAWTKRPAAQRPGSRLAAGRVGGWVRRRPPDTAARSSSAARSTTLDAARDGPIRQTGPRSMPRRHTPRPAVTSFLRAQRIHVRPGDARARRRGDSRQPRRRRRARGCPGT